MTDLLDEILEGETAEVTTTANTDNDQGDEVTPAEEAKGEETPAEEAPASEPEPPAQSEPPSLDDLMNEVKGLKSGLTAERRKRQEAESQLKQPQDLPDVFTDQEAFQKAIQEQISAASFNAQANLSEVMARQQFPDLDAKVDQFKVLQEANPELADRVRNAASPYHEVVKIVDNAERLSKLDNVDQLEAEVRAKVEAEIRAKVEKEIADKAKLASSIPQTLSDAASRGSVRANTHTGPTPLDSLLDN